MISKPRQIRANVNCPRRRRGSLSVALVVLLVALVGLLALSTDLALIACRVQALHVGAEASALAGGGELMDPAPLYGLPLDRPELSDPEGQDPFVTAYVTRARTAAIQLALQNCAFRDPAALLGAESGLDPDYPDGELVFGWKDDPAVGGPLVAWQGSGAVNSLLVRVHRTRARGNPLSLLFAQFLGLTETDSLVSACASVDQRVAGFRPVNHVNIPLLPLLIESEQGAAEWIGENAFTQDQFSVDTRSGYVQPGADGIPERALQVAPQTADGSGSAAGTNAQWIAWTGPAFDPDQLQQQIAHGLTTEDLVAYGGSLVLGADQTLPVLLASAEQTPPPAGLLPLLLAQRGRCRIWPLGQWDDSSQPGQVGDFAAGCVVDAYLDEDERLVVLVQPCLLQTCTALLRADRPRNPWIGKLLLSQ